VSTGLVVVADVLAAAVVVGAVVAAAVVVVTAGLVVLVSEPQPITRKEQTNKMTSVNESFFNDTSFIF
jgi:cytochrome c biogenesis factor